jgi:hypothetical protein
LASVDGEKVEIVGGERSPATAEEDRFNRALCDRVKALRLRRGISAEQAADLLGIKPDRYRKYENRSPLPAYLIERFAFIVNSDPLYVLTGRVQPAQRSSEVGPKMGPETRE